ncbi:hypothetical protein L1887_15249 [Cichorium endivia]|nr:hypothetical protein L1887_15249 [Cichorium endivia]
MDCPEKGSRRRRHLTAPSIIRFFLPSFSTQASFGFGSFCTWDLMHLINLDGVATFVGTSMFRIWEPMEPLIMGVIYGDLPDNWGLPLRVGRDMLGPPMSTGLMDRFMRMGKL